MSGRRKSKQSRSCNRLRSCNDLAEVDDDIFESEPESRSCNRLRSCNDLAEVDQLDSESESDLERDTCDKCAKERVLSDLFEYDGSIICRKCLRKLMN